MGGHGPFRGLDAPLALRSTVALSIFGSFMEIRSRGNAGFTDALVIAAQAVTDSVAKGLTFLLSELVHETNEAGSCRIVILSAPCH